MRDISENNIKKIISTDIFFNSCDQETEKITDIVKNLKIKESYEYPKDIIIHNIISNIFNKKEVTPKYCEIITSIISELTGISNLSSNIKSSSNTNLTQNIEYTLRFILKKISYFNKTNECLIKIKDNIEKIIDKKINNKIEKIKNSKSFVNNTKKQKTEETKKKTLSNYSKSALDYGKSFFSKNKKSIIKNVNFEYNNIYNQNKRINTKNPLLKKRKDTNNNDANLLIINKAPTITS